MNNAMDQMARAGGISGFGPQEARSIWHLFLALLILVSSASLSISGSVGSTIFQLWVAIGFVSALVKNPLVRSGVDPYNPLNSLVP